VRLSFALSDWIELGRRYPKARNALIEIRDADARQFTDGGYIGDPQAAFERLRDSRRRMKNWEDQQTDRREQQKKRFEAMAKTNSAFAHFPSLPEPPKFADNNFIEQTRQLIEILVGAGQKVEAEKICDQAVTVIDDQRLKTAVDDAEAKLRNKSEPAGAGK
jgi:hypothetical protein